MKNMIYPFLYHNWQRLFVAQKRSAVLRAMSEELNSKNKLKVLDAGCGTGQLTPMFLDTTKYEYTGVDNDINTIKYASFLFPTYNFMVVDIRENLPFKNKYDLIIVQSVFHHMAQNDVRRTLQTMKHVLDVSGEIIIQDIVHPENLSKKEMLLQKQLIRYDRGSYCRAAHELESLASEIFHIKDAFNFNLNFLRLNLYSLKSYTLVKR